MSTIEIAESLRQSDLVMSPAEPVIIFWSVLTRRLNEVGNVVRVSWNCWGISGLSWLYHF